MVLGKILKPKPGLQEAPRGPKTAKNQTYTIQEIRKSGCNWVAHENPMMKGCEWNLEVSDLIQTMLSGSLTVPYTHSALLTQKTVTKTGITTHG